MPQGIRLPLGLRLKLLFRKPHPDEDQAARHIADGQAKASALANMNRGRLSAELIRTVADDATPIGKVARRPDFQNLVLSIESQTLWGLFSEHETRFTAPANGVDRVMLSLALWLEEAHGFDWPAAVTYVKDVERRFNEADALFDVLARQGRDSYLVPRDDIFLKAVAALGAVT